MSKRKFREVAVPDQNCNETPDPKIDTIAADARGLDCIDAPPPIRFPPERVAELPRLITDDCYEILHSTRGICLVFNHEKFQSKVDNRPGSDADAKRIKTTFEKLKFTVIVRDHCSEEQVMKEIEKWSKPEHHEDKDCVCVFVLTHGNENDILYAFYDTDIYKKRKIWEPFTADKCPSLAGKPKLFFFQACRGTKLDSGVTLVQPRDCPGSSQADDIMEPRKIPTSPDILLAHGCAEGFSSWRDHNYGSWYVQALCHVLDKYSEYTDLLKMLTITARKVATEYKSFRGKVEVPSVTSTLTKKLYLTTNREPKKI